MPKLKIIHFFKKPKVYLSLLGMFLIFLVIPTPEFSQDYATLLLDQKGEFLNARIASDAQWRFAPLDSVPTKLEKCIVTFEDQNFYYHPGVDLLAVARAFKQNISNKRYVSGASTLSMQTVRLGEKSPKRNLIHKFFEMCKAFKYDLLHRKATILSTYLSYAPFGGNIVGARAASWRYFGRDVATLSWAESALLAVMPNSPAKLHLGRNRNLLLSKRNRLLKKLLDKGYLDKENYFLALQETIPDKPKVLPQFTPHLLQRAIADGMAGTVVNTTLSYEYQYRVQELVNKTSANLQTNGINNAAAMVLDLQKGTVLAYVGNTYHPQNIHQNYVDMVSAKRSYGSLLKPFLYAAMLQEGQIMPNMLIPDIPTNINGYAPENYDKNYSGAVSASTVIAHSLNVPSIRMLQTYGTDKFLHLLRGLGVNSLNQSGEHYGLSLVLGGGEANMWELASAYAQMAQKLGIKNKPKNILYKQGVLQDTIKNFVYDKPALWFMAEALSESKRPGEHGEWQYFESAQKIAWKTGTSFGLRDGWCIGFNQQHLVAVWLGNADGEGRAGLTGIGVAAPLMFDIFNTLPQSTWFSEPQLAMVPMYVCKVSGCKASEFCEDKQYLALPSNCQKSAVCNYHKKVFLDKSGTYRVHADCESAVNRKEQVFFVLPPVEEWYYKANNMSYKSLPPYRADCKALVDNDLPLKLIYPNQGAKLYIPTNLSGEKSKLVFKAAHRRPETKIFWHLDEKYLGETHQFHKMECFATQGVHKLTLVDEQGNMTSTRFEVLSK